MVWVPEECAIARIAGRLAGGYGVTLTDVVASYGRTSGGEYTGRRDRPSRDEIARLAYHFYETRGRRHGHDVDELVQVLVLALQTVIRRS